MDAVVKGASGCKLWRVWCVFGRTKKNSCHEKRSMKGGHGVKNTTEIGIRMHKLCGKEN